MENHVAIVRNEESIAINTQLEWTGDPLQLLNGDICASHS